VRLVAEGRASSELRPRLPRAARRATFLAMAGRTKMKRSVRTYRAMTFEEASAEDAERYLAMAPAERVRLAYDLFLACLSARGLSEPPRLRRVYTYPE
jgi:hypothetical protein